MHNVFFSTRFDLTRGHPQEMFNVDCFLPSRDSNQMEGRMASC
jgi:hypothetical protein